MKIIFVFYYNCVNILSLIIFLFCRKSSNCREFVRTVRTERWNRFVNSKKMAQESTKLCHRKSTCFMKVPLKSTEQIYLIFLIPALTNCFIYIINFAADLVVAIQHFKEENLLWGACTIAIMYAPALTYFILTISRPDWWMTDDDKVSKGIFRWFALQVFQLIGFVFFVLYR